MAQMTGIHSCGHSQLYCPRCHHTGCNKVGCPECIGNGTTRFCAVCGSVHVYDMLHYQVNKRQKAYAAQREQKGVQTRLAALEQSTGIHYDRAKNESTQGISDNCPMIPMAVSGDRRLE